MDAFELYQFFAPLFKAHPWTIAVVIGIAIWGAIWKALPTRYRVRIRAIPYIGTRLDALFDAVANAPILTQFLRIMFHGVLMGRVKPDRHNADELAKMLAEAVAKERERLTAEVAEQVRVAALAIPVTVPSTEGTSGR